MSGVSGLLTSVINTAIWKSVIFDTDLKVSLSELANWRPMGLTIANLIKQGGH